MTATYFRHGGGRSRNASLAEAEGRMPLTRAKRAVAARLGCRQAEAAAALRLLYDGEWHHVGKYATACSYYWVGDPRLPGVVAHILRMGGAAKWAARREKLRRKRQECRLGTYVCPAGRVLRLAKRRQAERAEAESALGRKITERHRIHDSANLLRLSDDRGAVALVREARMQGWTEQRIALALAGCGYRARFIRDCLCEA